MSVGTAFAENFVMMRIAEEKIVSLRESRLQ